MGVEKNKIYFYNFVFNKMFFEYNNNKYYDRNKIFYNCKNCYILLTSL